MEDTICAISSGIGEGAISIIRVSGKDAFLIVNKIFSKDILKEKSHTIKYGYILDGKKIIDEVLLMMMRSPKTYTTEDIIEINCHGGYIIATLILELLLKNGCRLAEVGEFTKRAFLNGRIDLTKAEAVNDLISAKTDKARELAINTVRGKLYNKINNLRNNIIKIIANIEVNIDYPEYKDEVYVTHEMIKTHLKDVKKELANIVKESNESDIVRYGLKVAIVGRPNVGKSSLLNVLIDEEKAIVTDIPGTTRDIVEGSIVLEGVPINFLDTAGLRDTKDLVEQIGVKKSYKVIDQADLIIVVLNYNEEITKEEEKFIKRLDKTKVIIFVNKDDLNKKLNIEFENVVYGNTLSLEGIRSLKDKIISMFKLRDIINKDLTYLSNIRQINLINQSIKSLDNAILSEKEGMPLDIIEIDLKEVWKFLGELTGEFYDEELVHELFTNFCLGK